MLQRTLDKLHAKDWSLSNKEVSAAGAFLPYIAEHAPEELTSRVIDAFIYEKSEAVSEKMFLDLVEHDHLGAAKAFLQAAAENTKNPQLAANLLMHSNGAAFRHAYTNNQQDFADTLVDTAHAEGKKLDRPTLAGDMLGNAGSTLLYKPRATDTEDKTPQDVPDIAEKTRSFLDAVRSYAERLDHKGLMADTLKADKYEIAAALAEHTQTEPLQTLIDETKAIDPQMVADTFLSEKGYAFLTACRTENREAVQLITETVREAGAQLGKPELLRQLLGSREGVALLVATDRKAFGILHDLVDEMNALPAQEGKEPLFTQALKGNKADLLSVVARNAPLAELDWMLGEIDRHAAETGQPTLRTELLIANNYTPMAEAALSGEAGVQERMIDVYRQQGAADARPDMLLTALTDRNFTAPIIAAFSERPDAMAHILATFEAEAEAHNKPELVRDLLTYDNAGLTYNAAYSGKPAALAATIELAEKWHARTGEAEPLVMALTSNDYSTAYVMGLKGNSESLGVYFEALERAADTLEKPELMIEAFAPKNSLGMAFSFVDGKKECAQIYADKALYTAEKFGKPELLTELLNEDMVRYINFSAQAKDNPSVEIALNLMDKAAEITGDADLAERAKAAHVIVECLALAREQNVGAVAEKLDTLTENMRAVVVESFPAKLTRAFEKDMPENARLREMGNGNKRWNAVLRTDAPHPDLEALSPQGFSPKVFDQLLPIIERAGELEGCPEKAPVMAYKASLLFSNPQELDRYLTGYSAKSAKTHTPVSEALSFETPMRGKWTPKLWKDATLQYGDAMAGLIKIAPEIEAYLKEHDQPFPQSPREMRPVAAQILYERAEENPRFAEVALEYKLDDKTFERGLDLMKKNPKTSDKLPDVTIDGKDLGQEGYYFTKLEPDDPRGLLLGEITNCCQSIGSAGERFAIHGATSENSGFYVWKQKTKGEMTPTDPIIAQSWAWIGEQGELVFDSFESLDKKTYHKLVEPFMEAFAEQALGKHQFSIEREGNKTDLTLNAIHMGCGGYDDLDYSNHIELPYPVSELAAQPIDFAEERPDSKNQYVIASLRNKEVAPTEKTWAQRIRAEQAAQQTQAGLG